jgi:hypothetical protein
MTTPQQQADAAPPGRSPALTDVIDVRHWLARQSGHIVATPNHLVDWLHELIVGVAADPDLTRLARLCHAEEHLRRFAALLDTAVDDGWAAQHLKGEELFERYAHDEQFRAELHAAAGIAAYTATRADPTLPADAYWAEAVIPPRRQQILTQAITDHAPRYHATIGWPARYIAEAHVLGGATDAEWNWIAYHIAAHPDLLHGPVRSPADVDARNRELADRLDREALTAFEAGEYQRALDLIDDAELHDPGRDWDTIRAYIRQNMDPATLATPVPASPAGPPDVSEAPAAGTAFPHPRHVVGERSQAITTPAPAALPRRATRR